MPRNEYWDPVRRSLHTSLLWPEVEKLFLGYKVIFLSKAKDKEKFKGDTFCCSGSSVRECEYRMTNNRSVVCTRKRNETPEQMFTPLKDRWPQCTHKNSHRIGLYSSHSNTNISARYLCWCTTHKNSLLLSRSFPFFLFPSAWHAACSCSQTNHSFPFSAV